MHNFYYFNFFWVFKGVLMKKVSIFMISAKLATLVLLKLKITSNKVYDVIIFVHDVTNKILWHSQIILQIWSYDQNLVTLAFLWQKLS